MDKYHLLEQLQKDILSIDCDPKAELPLSIGLEKGLSPDDFMVMHDGMFFREYSYDLNSAETKEDAFGLPVLQVHLTRSSIYDHLPEGLFFQPGQSAGKISGAAAMGFDYKMNRQRELEIRRFFLPFDNDFFLRRLEVESEEAHLLTGLGAGIITDYFIDFWGLENEIPKKYIVPFILLLPYAHKIAGDMPYTAQCLEELLSENVSAKQIASPVTNCESAFGKQPYELRLGVDTVCGEHFIEDYPVFEFHIGPLQHSAITDYLQGGKCFALLQTFYRFFLPACAEARTIIDVERSNKNICLGKGKEAVLGYSSFL